MQGNLPLADGGEKVRLTSGWSQRLLTAGAVAGAASLAFSATASILWWRDGSWLVRRTAYHVITLDWRVMDLHEWLLLAEFVIPATLVLSAIVISVRSAAAQWVGVGWFALAGIAVLYDVILPNPRYLDTVSPTTASGADAIWPALALGLQAILTAIFLFRTTAKLVHARRFRLTTVALAGCVIAIAAGIGLCWYGFIQRKQLA